MKNTAGSTEKPKCIRYRQLCKLPNLRRVREEEEEEKRREEGKRRKVIRSREMRGRGGEKGRWTGEGGTKRRRGGSKERRRKE